MAIEFGLSDFLQPAAVFGLRREFERNPWLEPEEFAQWQRQRLERIVRHAYAHVPYYTRLFDESGLAPADIRGPEELARLPLLSKSIVLERLDDLCAEGLGAFRPLRMQTSGSSGRRMSFYLDRRTNSLEFVYYWRYWNAAGYRLGDLFAEFTSEFYLRERREDRLIHRQRLAGRLLLNSLLLSRESARLFFHCIKDGGARFLKGLPSVLHHFSLLLRDERLGILPLRAVFSTGETLLPHQRRAIEAAFACKVYDSYGHMERVVAAAECPSGGLHVNSDYGILEIVDKAPLPDEDGARGRWRGRIVGTSLHNLGMPFLRYDTGDVAEGDLACDAPCPCGRRFPRLRRVLGRQEDVVVTADGRVAATLFLVFNDAPGLRAGQIVQEDLARLRVRVVKAADWSPGADAGLAARIRRHVGEAFTIEIEHVAEGELLAPGRKFKAVVSRVSAGP
ncbi:MAG: phenylacetate--CoA ligase family protein [Elusimicrobia bacterium]|nr:phenylacetate--CoA ligase family protein [Elusimicrobiota bacterium]